MVTDSSLFEVSSPGILAWRRHLRTGGSSGSGGSKGRERGGMSHLALQRTASMPAAAFALPKGFQVG